jgi:CheY-like chemotaxis protein
MRLEDTTETEAFAGKDAPAAQRPPERRSLKALRRHKMETIGRLAGGLVHDLNNVLTAIVLNTDMLAERLSEEQLSALAATTRLSAERAGDLTRQLLAFARGKQSPPRATDVNAVINGLAPLLRRTLGEHIELRLAADARHARVLLDAGQFESAILNLALNARDAMPHGGRLEIGTSNVAERPSGKMVTVSVSDEGAGMAPAIVRRAAEPFFTTKAEGTGTGLGLGMVQTCVRQAGGAVSIDSHLGRGTTVRLLLPVMAARRRDLRPAELPRNRPCGSETVLLVEDDRVIRAHVEAALDDFGYRVHSAADVRGALAAFAREEACDLLLTDVMIPGRTNGAGLAALLRRRRPSLRVLYTSGYGISAAAARRLQRDRRSAFLAKPFRRNELALAVRTLLDAPDHVAG